MGPARPAFTQVSLGCPAAGKGAGRGLTPGRRPVSDLLYIGLTIVVFAALYLVLKGVERFER